MAGRFIDPNDSARAFTPEKISALMAGLSLRVHGESGVKPILSRICDDIKAGLIKATNGQINRDEIVRYLKEQNLDSEYQFDLQPSSNTTGWPWGSHHTKLLGHLEAAARQFWVNYDPKNAKNTAPKNDTVINWLKEREVSDAMANAIASMLRPDGLPTGPRK